ncbi:MAG: helix-turn-helix domain-containing protein [Eubacteriales bacterium]
MLYKINTSQLPDVRHSGQITYNTGWTNNGRIRPVNMLLYVVSGEMRVELSGMFGEQTVSLLPGSYLFIPSRTYFRAYLFEKCNYRYVHFTPPDILSPVSSREAAADIVNFEKMQHKIAFTENVAQSLGYTFVSQTGSASSYLWQLDALFQQMDKYRMTVGLIAKHRLDLTFLEMLLLISEDTLGEIVLAKRQSSVLSEMLLWISRHYTEKITLEDMSRRFGFSKQHIIRLFKTYQKQAVIQYINKFRLQKSLEMLANTDISIGEIARSTGFANLYYYTRLYRNTYGHTPTEYRRRFTENSKIATAGIFMGTLPRFLRHNILSPAKIIRSAPVCTAGAGVKNHISQ